MLDVINRFREYNGVGPVQHTDNLVNQYCKFHCLDMSRNRNVYHAPDCYLEGWAEAVAMMSYCDHWQDKIVFDVLGSSEKHRNILLSYNKISYADHIHDWVVYVCIRGQR